MDDIPDVTDADADALAARTTGLSVNNGSEAQPGTAQPSSASAGGMPRDSSMPDIDDIPDMEDESAQQVDDPAAAEPAPVQPAAAAAATGTDAAPASANSNLVQLRTYDCLITYDKYYQTPRMWLLGYDEHKAPLPPHLVFQDISSDYAQKTVTVETFPHLSSVSCATVHPCKHASVMKKVIDRTNASLAAAKQQEAGGASTPTAERKRGWLSTAKKAALGGGSSKDAKQEITAEDQQEGLRVDQCTHLLIILLAKVYAERALLQTSLFSSSS